MATHLHRFANRDSHYRRYPLCSAKGSCAALPLLRFGPCTSLWALIRSNNTLAGSSLGSCGTNSSVRSLSTLRQFLQQGFGVLQVRRIKSLRKPTVHGREQVIGVLALALVLPQAGQAGVGAEFPRFGLLVASDIKGLAEAVFGLGLIWRRLFQE